MRCDMSPNNAGRKLEQILLWIALIVVQTREIERVIASAVCEMYFSLSKNLVTQFDSNRIKKTNTTTKIQVK